MSTITESYFSKKQLTAFKKERLKKIKEQNELEARLKAYDMVRKMIVDGKGDKCFYKTFIDAFEKVHVFKEILKMWTIWHLQIELPGRYVIHLQHKINGNAINQLCITKKGYKMIEEKFNGSELFDTKICPEQIKQPTQAFI